MRLEQENIYKPLSTTRAVMNLDWEVPEQKKRLYFGSMVFADAGAILSRAQLTGELPPAGQPALVLTNHLREKDVFVAFWTGLLAGNRQTVMMVRNTVVNPDDPERKKTLLRRTRHNIDSKSTTELGPMKRIVRKLRAEYSGWPAPILVGKEGVDPLEEAVKNLEMGRLVWMFYQGTRSPALDLEDDEAGAASLIVEHLKPKGLDVPIFPVGISGTNKGLFGHVEVHIGQPFSYKDIPRGKTGRIGELLAARRHIRDRVAEQVVDEAAKSAHELHRLGMSLKQIKEARERSTDLDSAVWLLKQTHDWDARPVDERLREIDSVRFY